MSAPLIGPGGYGLWLCLERKLNKKANIWSNDIKGACKGKPHKSNLKRCKGASAQNLCLPNQQCLNPTIFFRSQSQTDSVKQRQAWLHLACLHQSMVCWFCLAPESVSAGEAGTRECGLVKSLWRWLATNSAPAAQLTRHLWRLFVKSTT